MNKVFEITSATGSARRQLRSLLLKRKPFYKAYPYQLPVDIGSANHRGVVSIPRRFFFNRVPKAANSSIVKALAYGSGREPTNIDVLKDELTKPSQLTKAQVEDFRKSFFKFTVVRNPYSRTLSAYLDLIVSRGYYKELALGSFEDFIKFLDGGGLYKNIHWAPQTSFLLLPLEDFDLVGRFEEIELAVKEIASQTAIPIDLARSSHRPHATDAKTKIAEYYSGSTKAAVRSLFSDDFIKLGYPSELLG